MISIKQLKLNYIVESWLVCAYFGFTFGG